MKPKLKRKLQRGMVLALVMSAVMSQSGVSWSLEPSEEPVSDRYELVPTDYGRLLGGPYPDAFVDDNGHPSEAANNYLAYYGVVSGCNPPDNSRICPDDELSRAEMAKFLNKLFDLYGLVCNTPGELDQRGWTPLFKDAYDHWGRCEIANLQLSAITTGCAIDLFCPEDSVTRGMVAAFLTRGLGLPPGGDIVFFDTDTNIFREDVLRAVSAGIGFGCAKGYYCPDNPILRGEMTIQVALAHSYPG